MRIKLGINIRILIPDSGSDYPETSTAKVKRFLYHSEPCASTVRDESLGGRVDMEFWTPRGDQFPERCLNDGAERPGRPKVGRGAPPGSRPSAPERGGARRPPGPPFHTGARLGGCAHTRAGKHLGLGGSMRTSERPQDGGVRSRRRFQHAFPFPCIFGAPRPRTDFRTAPSGADGQAGPSRFWCLELEARDAAGSPDSFVGRQESPSLSPQ